MLSPSHQNIFLLLCTLLISDFFIKHLPAFIFCGAIYKKEVSPVNFSEDTFIELLTLQYIQGEKADTPLDYVKMYRDVRAKISDAYQATKEYLDDGYIKDHEYRTFYN